MKIAIALRALANERRLLILDWLRDPKKHFRAQVDGDLVEDGVCGLLIAEKLGVSAPTLSEHMRVLLAAKLVKAKRIAQCRRLAPNWSPSFNRVALPSS